MMTQEQMLLEAVQGIEERLERSSKAKDIKYCYHYIPLSIPCFFTLLSGANAVCNVLQRWRRYPTFLDIGCGIGMKVALAEGMGFDASGIEINKNYISLARKILPATKIREANALRYTKYGRFDVLYAYCPMNNEILEIELEDRIFKCAKENAVVICALHEKTSTSIEAIGFTEILPEVYLKSKDKNLIVAVGKEIIKNKIGGSSFARWTASLRRRHRA